MPPLRMPCWKLTAPWISPQGTCVLPIHPVRSPGGGRRDLRLMMAGRRKLGRHVLTVSEQLPDTCTTGFPRDQQEGEERQQTFLGNRLTGMVSTDPHNTPLREAPYWPRFPKGGKLHFLTLVSRPATAQGPPGETQTGCAGGEPERLYVGRWGWKSGNEE